MLRITTPTISDLIFLPNDIQPDGIKVRTAHKINNSAQLTIKEIKIDGLVLFIIDLKTCHIQSLMIETTESVWLMSFVLNNSCNISQDTNPLKETFLTADGYHTVILNSQEKLHFTTTNSIRMLIVCMAVNNIKKLLPPKAALQIQNSNERNYQTLKGSHINTPMDDIIKKTITHVENNTLHPILLVAKMLELLFLTMEQSSAERIQSNLQSVKPNDLKKLELAKILVAQNLQSPCSLIELSRKVGLNDFKLKKGFKETFGNTVFGYLLELRMEKARAMLLSPSRSVSEVAHEVGYKNAHHFTVAFKKRFGCLPSKITRFSILLLLSISLAA